MYPKRIIKTTSVIGDVHKGEKTYKPLSHFITRKAVDVDNSALKCDANVAYESEEVLSSMDKGEMEMTAIGVASPNYDIFDFVEQYGSKGESVVTDNGESVKDN